MLYKIRRNWEKRKGNLQNIPDTDLPSSLPSPTALPVPPLVSQSTIPFLEQENIPPACCVNPPVTKAPLVPIQVESHDVEGSGGVEEGNRDRVDEGAASQLGRDN